MDGHTVNPETIPAVLGMKKLRYLTLNIAHADKTAAGYTNVKKESAEQLQKDMPKCRIFLP